MSIVGLTDQRQTSEGFWGPIVQSVQSGIGTVTSDILPNWVAGQLQTQRSYTAYQPTYVPYSPEVLDNAALQDVRTTKAGYLTGDILSHNQGGIFLLGIIIVGGLLLFKMM